jgi:prephenate dehydrogenase
LIGGSLALALKKAGAVSHVCGFSRDAQNLTQAIELGIIDQGAKDLADCVKDADLVMLAVPLQAMRSIFSQIKPHLKAHAIISDVGSAKGIVVDYAREIWPEGLPSGFIPGHPIAGTEKSGVSAGFAELFNERKVILTPVSESSPQALETLTAVWQICGARVESMDAQTHDDILAATSHLPHVLAFGLVDLLAHHSEHEAIFRYAAGGFRDFTRIASSDPVMWRDICLTNKQAIAKNIRAYQQHLSLMLNLVEQADAQALEHLFTRAKHARDAFTDSLK